MSFDDYIIMEDYELVVNRWGFLKKIYKNWVGEWRVAPVVSRYGALNPNARVMQYNTLHTMRTL